MREDSDDHAGGAGPMLLDADAAGMSPGLPSGTPDAVAGGAPGGGPTLGPDLVTAPTLEDVARVAGVSRATVSRVVNGKRRVAPAIQEVVRAALAETGYVPNLAARSLVTRRTGTVAVVISGAEAGGKGGEIDFADPFFGRVMGGVVRALRPRDVDPLVMIAETDADRARVLSALRNGNADGALLVSTHADDPLPALLVENGLPAVMFARPASRLPISFVDVANRDGAALAAEHLVARGCTRVAAISGPLDVPAAQDRLDGFRDAMARLGHPFVRFAEGNFTFESGRSAMDQLLAGGPVDAVFASNDLMAMGAVESLYRHGLSVPDVRVIGFDDSQLGAVSRPSLTSVRQPIEEMAGEMARILLDVVLDARLEPERRLTSVIFTPTLVVRDSA